MTRLLVVATLLTVSLAGLSAQTPAPKDAGAAPQACRWPDQCRKGGCFRPDQEVDEAAARPAPLARRQGGALLFLEIR